MFVEQDIVKLKRALLAVRSRYGGGVVDLPQGTQGRVVAVYDQSWGNVGSTLYEVDFSDGFRTVALLTLEDGDLEPV